MIKIIGIGLRYLHQYSGAECVNKICILLGIKFDRVIFAYGCDFTILEYFHVPSFI